MSKSVFVVESESFKGPLELLLELVEKRKLFINEISLAKVADDFIEYINQRRDMPLDEATRFLSVAATLTLIKSRSLLPSLKLTDEEEGDIEELKKRLLKYKIFKDTTGYLKRRQMYLPRKRQPAIIIKNKPKDLSLNSVLYALENFFNSLPEFIKKPEVSVSKRVSLTQVMKNMRQRIFSASTTRFFSIAERSDRVGLVVSFLALLELVRRYDIVVDQRDFFDDIEIKTSVDEVPHY